MANQNCRMSPDEFRQCMKRERRKQRKKYYSRVIIVSAAKDGGNAFAFPLGTKVFAYGYGFGDAASSTWIGGDATAAGTLRTAMGTAQRNDTNLTTAKETEKGSDFYIQKIGILPHANSDAEALRFLSPELDFDLLFDTESAFHIGPMPLAPAGGGLTGSGRTDISAAAPGATGALATNGFPDAANMLDLGLSPIKWAKDGPQKHLTIQVSQARAVTVSGAAGGIAGSIRADLLVVMEGIEIFRASA